MQQVTWPAPLQAAMSALDAAVEGGDPEQVEAARQGFVGALEVTGAEIQPEQMSQLMAYMAGRGFEVHKG